ncbi:MAG: ABC transporter ATP-binding protein [Methanobacterium sp.]|jgi:ATP-binding cassette subfamily B protein
MKFKIKEYCKSSCDHQRREGMFKDLLNLAGKRRTKLIASCILLILSAGFSVIPFFLIYLLLIELFRASSHINIWYLVALIPVVYILTYIVLIYAYDLSHRAAYEILYDVRLELGERMTRLPLGYFNERNTGELGTIMNENVERLEFFLAHHLPEIIATTFVPIFLGVFLFLLDWRMALASTTLPLLALVVLLLSTGRKWPQMVEKFLTAQSRVNATIVEYTQGIKAIKAFNQTAESFNKFQTDVSTWRDSLMGWSRETAFPFTIYETLITSTLVVVLFAGIWLYQNGTLSLEMFLLFLLLGPLFGTQFMRIYQFLRYWLEEKECVDRVNKLRYAQVLPDCEEDKTPSRFDITFKNVSFSYDGNEKYALQDICLHVAQGTVCALVGPSGAGKSTIARLIPRLWDVEKGEILIGEYNIKDIPIQRLLSYISIVFQDVFLFSDSILENIRLGKQEATEEEVRAAARAARCEEFIEMLPEGYYTMIGEKGVKLSAGEQQRISIARALLKDAPLVILDEATAFVDPENENLIQEAISNLIRGKTVIIIAHRLSTITDVDQILVIENGRIVEQGKHEDLVKTDGLYSRMWEAHVSTIRWGIRR